MSRWFGRQQAHRMPSRLREAIDLLAFLFAGLLILLLLSIDYVR